MSHTEVNVHYGNIVFSYTCESCGNVKEIRIKKFAGGSESGVGSGNVARRRAIKYSKSLVPEDMEYVRNTDPLKYYRKMIEVDLFVLSCRKCGFVQHWQRDAFYDKNSGFFAMIILFITMAIIVTLIFVYITSSVINELLPWLISVGVIGAAVAVVTYFVGRIYIAERLRQKDEVAGETQRLRPNLSFEAFNLR